jgi:SAM-dependent methyltransferase
VGERVSDEAVIWHDLECGSYAADLALWRGLAAEHGGPVLDVGAGTGRVALALAREGHDVIALERDATLAAELERRARGLPVRALVADACAFALREPVTLAIVPMQTVHLLADRDAFLRCARAALAPGGTLAVSLLGEGVEPFELELDADAVELGGVRYESAPTALRREAGAVVLARRRSRIAGAGEPRTQENVVRLHELDAARLVAEAAAHGLAPAGVLRVPPTRDHAGSEVVLLEAVG